MLVEPVVQAGASFPRSTHWEDRPPISTVVESVVEKPEARRSGAFTVEPESFHQNDGDGCQQEFGVDGTGRGCGWICGTCGLREGGSGLKSFFDDESRPPNTSQVPAVPPSVLIPAEALGRIAVYDSLTAAPRVEDVTASDPAAFIETLAARVYQIAHEQGGRVPYTLIREIVENFIHARFSEVVVTIIDAGNTIRFSDQGPGISDKDKAFLPGYSTATGAMKQIIRGVGSGLPIVKECLSFADGAIDVQDNIGCGTVVTLRVEPSRPAQETAPEVTPAEEPTAFVPRLSTRQKQVLSLVMELGSVGPSVVSKELRVALSTAYRDLAFLEASALIATDGFGKRALTEEGVAFLDELFN